MNFHCSIGSRFSRRSSNYRWSTCHSSRLRSQFQLCYYPVLRTVVLFAGIETVLPRPDGVQSPRMPTLEPGTSAAWKLSDVVLDVSIFKLGLVISSAIVFKFPRVIHRLSGFATAADMLEGREHANKTTDMDDILYIQMALNLTNPAAWHCRTRLLSHRASWVILV